MEKILSYVPSGRHKLNFFVLISVAAVVFDLILYMSESSVVYLNTLHAYNWVRRVDGHIIITDTSASNLINIPGYYLTKNRFTNTYALEAPSRGNMTLTLKILNKVTNVARTEMIELFEENRTLALNFTKSNGAKYNVLLLNERLDMNYSKKIDRIRHVISLNVYWSTKSSAKTDFKENIEDALVQKYHDWSVSPGTCQGHHGNNCLKRQTKSTVIRDDPKPKPWQPTFLHIIPNAAVHKHGYVRTSHIQFVPYGCNSTTIKRPIKFKATALFKEVFVIAHYWGGAFFHMAIEGLPRLVPYLQFLRQHQHIKIHLVTKASSKVAYKRYLKMLDINPHRIVTGHVRADIVYLPKGGSCGVIAEPHGQIFSREMRSFIAAQYPRETAAESARTVVLIQRSRHRRLKQYTAIKSKLQTIAHDYKLDLKIYSDAPTPSDRNTWLMFYNAVMIVAPHGAGLSNMLLSRPGIYVVEVLCKGSSNFCYKHLSVRQGNYYRGIVAKSGCEGGMTVNVTQVMDAVKALLKFNSKL